MTDKHPAAFYCGVLLFSHICAAAFCCGIYFVRMQSGNFTDTLKLVLVR
jgi:hypothetical protein